MTAPPTLDMPRLIHALADVERERFAQHDQWGTQRHDFAVWLVVLLEECGEAAAALLAARATPGHAKRAAWLDVRRELVQIAAVAVAAIEHIDEVQS